MRGTDTPHILNLIITNDENISDLEYQSPIGKSDHCVLSFKFNCYAILKDRQNEKFLYDKADWDALKVEIENLNWEEELNSSSGDINVIWSAFQHKINTLQEKYIPKRKYKSQGHKGKFPVDENTRNLIKQKHVLSRKLAENNSNEHRRAYNKIRNKVSSAVKKIKKEL